MAQAIYRHGQPLMVDYTPGSAVTAGDVIVVGDQPRIAHSDIAANVLGGLAAGGAVYTVPKTAGGGTAIAAGKKVYWDDTNNVITETPSTHKIIGVTVAASLDADTTQDIIHGPDGFTNAGIAGVAAGYKVARGVHTTVAASDTVVTGLTTVVAVVVSLGSDPGDNPFLVSATIGDQAGAPAAGSILIKSWKHDGTDPTPTAATTFSKAVNWIAIGT